MKSKTGVSIQFIYCIANPIPKNHPKPNLAQKSVIFDNH